MKKKLNLKVLDIDAVLSRDKIWVTKKHGRKTRVKVMMRMPKTKDAFALRDFDGTRILQRPFFRDFHFDADKTDEEILSNTAAKLDDTLHSINQKISNLEKLQEQIGAYQKVLTRHVKRLEKYLHAIEQKGIVDTTADLDALRKKYTKALTLLLTYSDSFWAENPNNYKITVFHSKAISVRKSLDDIYVGVAENLRELYRAERFYYRKVFAERLKTARKAAGLTQAKLGELTGVPRRNISDYEGTMPFEPNLSILVKFAQALNKPVGWFLGVN